MKDKQRLVLVSTTNEPRIQRFTEEAQKNDLDSTLLDFYKSVTTIDGIYQDNEKFSFRPNDLFLGISNSMASHYVSALIEREGFFIWPSSASVVFSDKFYTNALFKKHAISTPRTVLITDFDINVLNTYAAHIGGFPCVIKSNKGSMGKNVAMVHSAADIVQFIKNAMESASHATVPFKKYSFQLQEFIEESSGTDFRVLCLKNEIIGGIKRTATEGFKANISLGGTAEKFLVSPELTMICQKIMREGNLFYAGIDFVKRGDTYLAIEINTSAQFKGFEENTGINVAQKIIRALMDEKNSH